MAISKMEGIKSESEHDDNGTEEPKEADHWHDILLMISV